MSSAKPTRKQADLAEVLELILDKGIVINADIAVTVGDTELLGVELRAAIASFETAAEYGLAFPSGTDMRRVEEASGRKPLEDDDEIDLGIDASSGGESESSRSAQQNPPRERPDPRTPMAGADDEGENGGSEEADAGGVDGDAERDGNEDGGDAEDQ